ncbi:Rrf2 family transcriptional regulator [Actinocorallia sp. API 0066]|uniref:Rrf2 family transcriptional regulator n=1 Tax=Actinocorallia sp. API 0066 TaxID=2896846 RepID=UPI001E337FCE|nr:Rrf2 family transcriptional regulator [Actinocorallia sp. API 0066]MCD0447831.1 Rrf2 family transcriptional regulator [Actinocorallia sp. API 0066]
MQITARVEYALRALLALASAEPAPLTAAALSETHSLPLTFLQAILGDLRRADLVFNQRLPDPGYRLARPAATITVGQVLRAIDGKPAGRRAELPASGAALDVVRTLDALWAAADSALLSVIDSVTLADLRDGRLPN